MPLYPLYSLLFVHAGLSGAGISALFAIWSAVGLLAEVPTGALADRFSRRTALVAAGVAQAGGYLLWVLLPGFSGFAGGFAAWGLGGALASGALEALLYDGLTGFAAESHYPWVLGLVTSSGLVAQLPTAVAASLLFFAGGYPLVGWVSVGSCLAAAALACCLPEPPRNQGPDGEPSGAYVEVLRAA